MTEQQWIDWKPQPGDIKPAGYRYWSVGDWVLGGEQGLPVNPWDAANNLYQIPAPAVTTAEDRPHWIDPQCKFRWGDMVKDKKGCVWFVNNPHDGDNLFPVICTKTRNYLAPYSGSDVPNWYMDDNIDVFNEADLELFPEDLPRHFDDRLLGADQPQEQPATSRVPREIWVSSYGNRLGPWHYPSLESALAEGSASVPVHFREVL